LLIFSGSFWN